MTSALRPLPAVHRHYADPAINDEAQLMGIDVAIDRVHYPTLGCPALLSKAEPTPLLVWLSLSERDDPAKAAIALVDRHRGDAVVALVAGPPVALGGGPASRTGGKRMLWQFELDVAAAPPALYDLRVESAAGVEVQPNAVRIYAAITGDEKVAFCGDSQYHVDNAICLQRFIAAINTRDDIAWIALIGDGCDNGVKSKFRMFRLVISAGPEPVTSYYLAEFGDLAKRLLPQLNKPIVVVPGNHDGMAAYADYAVGEACDVFLGPDPANRVAYDGLHHFRRSLGPLYFAFDWGRTRYLCMNSVELDRRERLGYHAIVANWGGFVRSEQRAWLAEELTEASAAGRHAVVLIHHDPRGGSEGTALGYYSDVRPYRFEGLYDILVSYAKYLGSNASTWQQEWMQRPGDAAHLDDTRKLLELLIEHRVHAVIMGHDNETWVESYGTGDRIFDETRTTFSYAAQPGGEAPPPDQVVRAEQLIEARDFEGLVALLAPCATEPSNRAAEAAADAVLDAALARLAADGKLDPELAYAPPEIERWKLRANAPIHFIHVDDIGAYKYTRESHFANYGYVVAQLAEGRPIELQRTSLQDQSNPPVSLAVE